MKKNNLFIYAILLFVSIVIFSCKKTTNNILTGNWRLTAKHTTIIDTNGLIRDTIPSDTTYNSNLTQILEFNSNLTYSITDYSVSPTTVVTGKYSFSGQGQGAIIMTPNATLIPATSTYVLFPATSIGSATLIFPTSTSGQGYTESDTTIYTFY